MPTQKRAPSQRSADTRRQSTKKTAKRRWVLPIIIILIFAVVFVLASKLFISQPATSTTPERSTPFFSQEPPAENTLDTELFITDDKGTVSYEDERTYSVQGIDVSSHQDIIDWSALAEEGVAFAILRIGYRGYTEGGLVADELFSQNLEEAQANGIHVGVYFYSQATSVEEAQEEAEFTLELLNNRTLELPVFFDWELHTASDARSQSTDSTILTDCALAFCQTIESGGYQPGVYFYSSLALDIYDLSLLSSYTFWLSQPGEIPDFDYEFTFWQYTYEGQLSGISGNVDLDMMLVSSSATETEAEASSEVIENSED